jgi:hypothetical protein
MPQVTNIVFFENIYEKIVIELANAKYSVKICVAWINAPMLRETVSDLKNSNVSLEIIYDDNMSNLGIKRFESAKLYPISMDGRAFMHNKFCIIDDETLITGSFNWTHNAAKSFENLIIIRNDYRIIKDYLHEFEDLKMYSTLPERNRCKRRLHRDGSRCNSLCYNVGIFGYADGMDGAQEVSIWRICNAHQVAECVKIAIIDDDPSSDQSDINEGSDTEWFLNKDRMLSEFIFERKNLHATPYFFLDNLGLTIQAYGYVRLMNEGEYLRYGSTPEYFLDLLWRDVYWRKIIPPKLFEHNGNLDELLERHKPGGAVRS